MYTERGEGLGISWSSFIPESVRTGIKSTRELFGIPPITVRTGLTAAGEEKAAEAQRQADQAETAAGAAAEQIAADAVEQKRVAAAVTAPPAVPKLPVDVGLPPSMRLPGVVPPVPDAPPRPTPGILKALPAVLIVGAAAALLMRRRRA